MIYPKRKPAAKRSLPNAGKPAPEPIRGERQPAAAARRAQQACAQKTACPANGLEALKKA